MFKRCIRAKKKAFCMIINKYRKQKGIIQKNKWKVKHTMKKWRWETCPFNSLLNFWKKVLQKSVNLLLCALWMSNQCLFKIIIFSPPKSINFKPRILVFFHTWFIIFKDFRKFKKLFQRDWWNLSMKITFQIWT